MKAVTIKKFGGPEVLTYADVDKPKPGSREALVRIEAAGLNFIDIYQRTGLYPIDLPTTLGMEAAGVVEEIGDQVTRFKPGDRVAFTNVAGAYANFVAADQDKLVPIPDGVTCEQAAASMLQGCTAHYLSQSTYPVQAGQGCLIHAGAGGVGLLLTQIAKNIGAFVITTVSTPEKAALSKAAGADEVILYTEQDFEAEVKRITQGGGLHVVYDSVGQATFDKSLNCLRPRGYMVLYGNASGPVTQFNPATLAPKGSLFLTRPTLFNYIAEREELEWRAGQFMGWVKNGDVKLRMEHNYPLSETQEAHRALEGRKTTGKVLLIPEPV